MAVGAVVGFPHGSSTTESKRYETEIACRDGATEIDMVINIGKALAGDWAYVEKDIRAVVREAHKRGAIVKVIFENDFLPATRSRRSCAGICEKAGADFVKTSTGYGFVKGADGTYSYQGATEHDLVLMRKAVSREGAGEGRRRRTRPRRPDARARPRHDALRRDGDGGDARGLQTARESGTDSGSSGASGASGCARYRRVLNGRRAVADLQVLPAMRRRARTSATDEVAPFRCEACGFLYFFNPAVAVAALILRDDGKALFIRRAKEPAKGRSGAGRRLRGRRRERRARAAA